MWPVQVKRDLLLTTTPTMPTTSALQQLDLVQLSKQKKKGQKGQPVQLGLNSQASLREVHCGRDGLTDKGRAYSNVPSYSSIHTHIRNLSSQENNLSRNSWGESSEPSSEPQGQQRERGPRPQHRQWRKRQKTVQTHCRSRSHRVGVGGDVLGWWRRTGYGLLHLVYSILFHFISSRHFVELPLHEADVPEVVNIRNCDEKFHTDLYSSLSPNPLLSSDQRKFSRALLPVLHVPLGRVIRRTLVF